MADVSKEQVESALKAYIDPNSDRDLVTSKSIKSIAVDGGKVIVDVQLGYPADSFKAELTGKLQDLVSGIEGVSEASVTVECKIVEHSVQKGVKTIKGVKNIIAVASGKGGVGKSTVSANLALALAAEGAKVGVLDADIYGPSQTRMLGVEGRPDSPDGKTLEPMKNYGIESMSIGNLIDEETPMIWRGPMVTQALEQLLNDTNWSDLDYLIIDLPPGTGDTQLTLAQKVPVSGAVIVTTPQDIALLDARKGLKMFQKVEVPVLGIVENMSMHICSSCGHEEHIFGRGGGEKMADQYDVDFLGSLPLDISIRENADNGKPTVVADPEGRISEIYMQIARRTAARLAIQAKNYEAKFPQIVIAND
ncbi:ATPase [Solemya pervernicosa gill symbiont]|uniref:Iron-sulfur cluster carrier protein n=2 Tax=Gammaproteobacteria incertae sedis TaxID=118884 RepID=A0A1T2L8M7_9GAMM|nr:iron-sulfur cluster carrier protein ApbC [Candidatus Reidiella endopervernicosa]OOZ41384.1 ATPase [Solemya pervernicosa gill symbiont]QKQ27577.1 iron-sulfur cluster carrier protein ApbC [Candidatus Reidiella endopervernicosa]